MISLEEAIKMAEKALEAKKRRWETKQSRLLRTLSPNEIWNEFSHSNLKLPVD